jgi:hypothetical protein
VRRDGVEPPVCLALGGLGLAQQRRALPGGEVVRFGVVAQVFGLESIKNRGFPADGTSYLPSSA